jgi:hypothetical protein
VAVAVALIAGYALWGLDPQMARAADDAMEAAREAAATLEAQGADPTTCVAKLDRHFPDLTVEETAEVLCEMSYDAAANAEALREVHGFGDYEAVRTIQRAGCDDWCGALHSVSVDAEELLDQCGGDCDAVFLFDAQTQCFGLVDLQAEDWLRGRGFEDSEYLSTTARPYVEKFAPALMFDKKAKTFPMDAQKWWDQELCGEYGGPFKGDEISESYCSQVATSTPECKTDQSLCTTNDVQHLRKGECTINGKHDGTPCLHHEDCGSAGCALATCAYPSDPTRSFPDDPERMRYSSLPDYRIPTYYQVRRCGSPTTEACDALAGTDYYCSTGQLRIIYWWFYGYQHSCQIGFFCIDGGGAHRGDWEWVVVTTSNDRRRIAAVTYKQHRGWYTKVHSERGDQKRKHTFLNLSLHDQCYADGEPCEADEDCDSHWRTQQPGYWKLNGLESQVCEPAEDERVRADGHPVVYAGKIAHGCYHDDGGENCVSCCYYQDPRNPDYAMRCIGGDSEGKPCEDESDCPGGECHPNRRRRIDYPATGWATWESPLISLDGDEQDWIKHSRGTCQPEDHTRPPSGDSDDPKDRPLLPDEDVPWDVEQIYRDHSVPPKKGFDWGHRAVDTQPPRYGFRGEVHPNDLADLCTLRGCVGTSCGCVGGQVAGCCGDKPHVGSKSGDPYTLIPRDQASWGSLSRDDDILSQPGGSLDDRRPHNAPYCTGQCIGGDRDGKLCEKELDCPGGQCRGYACCEQRPYENLDASDPWSSCVP